MPEIEALRTEIEKLKERNRRVEANKAWETSLTRKLLLMALTYIIITLTLISINNSDPFKNAIIPTIGFFLSTLTLPFFKNLWQEYIYKK